MEKATKEEEARNGRKSLNTGTQGRKKLVVKSTPFRFHRPLGTRSLSLSYPPSLFSLPLPLTPSLSLSPLYSSAFLFFFDNIKRPLVAARAFIKSAPERKKASRALEGTAVRALHLPGLWSVLRDRSYRSIDRSAKGSREKGESISRGWKLSSSPPPLTVPSSFSFSFFFRSRMNIDVRS